MGILVTDNRHLAVLQAMGIAATGRDLLGEAIDRIPTRKAKVPNLEKQSAAEAKRHRRAAKRIAQQGKEGS